MRKPLPPHRAGDQDRNFRLLTTAVGKRGLSSRSQGARVRAETGSWPSPPSRSRFSGGPGSSCQGCCHPCPGHAHAQTVQTSGTCGAPGRRPGSVYECQGAGWGEDAGIPCPRRRASSWKVELAPGGMPRAQGVGICWHSSLRRTWGPTAAHHAGLPLTHSRGRSAPSPRALRMGSSNVPLAPRPPHTVGHLHWHQAAHGRTQTLCWTPARLRMAFSAGSRPLTGHLWVWAHGPIHSL